MQMLNPLRFKQYFSTSAYLQSRSDVLLPEKPAYRTSWTVGRELCLFRCFDLGTIPRSKRAMALEVSLKRWSPFQNFGHYTVWEGSSAMVWIWDQNQVDARIDEYDVIATRILPESVLYARHDDGVCLYRPASNGIVAQIWHQQVLVAEKWFPEQPDQNQWRRFIHGVNIPAGCSPGQDTLQDYAQADPSSFLIEQTAPGDIPWGDRHQLLHNLTGLRWELYLGIAVAVCLVAVLLWQLTGYFLLYRAVDAVEARTASAASRVQEVLSARESAVKLNEENLQLLRLLDLPDQQFYAVKIMELLTGKNALLKEWHFNLDTLEFTVEDASLNTVNMINALEALPGVASVTLERSRRRNQHTFKVTLVVYHTSPQS